MALLPAARQLAGTDLLKMASVGTLVNQPATGLAPEQLEALKAALGVEVEKQLIAGGEEPLTDRTLARWLRARKFSVDKAAKDLSAHAAWRANKVPNKIIPDAAAAVDLAQDKGFFVGWDKQGHPTSMGLVAKHTPNKNKEDYMSFLMYVMDTTILAGHVWEKKTGRQWDGKTICILNMKGMKLANYDYTSLMSIFELLQNHYVERLHKLYLHCAPSFFNAIWTVVSPFVDPVTRQKVQFVSEKAEVEIFGKDYDDGMLPPAVGGTGPLKPLPQSRAELMAEMEQLTAAGQKLEQANEAMPAGMDLKVSVN